MNRPDLLLSVSQLLKHLARGIVDRTRVLADISRVILGNLVAIVNHNFVSRLRAALDPRLMLLLDELLDLKLLRTALRERTCIVGTRLVSTTSLAIRIDQSVLVVLTVDAQAGGRGFRLFPMLLVMMILTTPLFIFFAHKIELNLVE